MPTHGSWRPLVEISVSWPVVVTVRRGATIGAGTTLTKEAPADKLTLSRAKQMTIDAWQRPVKQPKK